MRGRSAVLVLAAAVMLATPACEADPVAPIVPSSDGGADASADAATDAATDPATDAASDAADGSPDDTDGGGADVPDTLDVETIEDVPDGVACESDCFELGATRCDGDAIERCEQAGDCTFWTPEPCDAGTTCELGDAGAACVAASWPSGVNLLTLDSAGQAQATVNFADGADLPDLSWASRPDVACWDNPRTTDEFFSNQHLAFALSEPVPAWSDITIELTPASNAEANLYVLRQGPGSFQTPPELPLGAYCELPSTFGSIGGETRYTFRVYNDTNVFWGVANRGRNRGDDDTDVAVRVSVSPVPAEERCYDDAGAPDQYPPHVERITLDADGQWSGIGQLADGAQVCGDGGYLDDAFCVPATQLDRFSGNQRFYAIDGGVPDQSIVTITVVPDPGVDVSIFGSQQGAGTGFRIPPNFPTTLCESGLRYSGNNPGEAESITLVSTTNGYEVFFAVAGTAEQGAAGGFTVAVDLQTSPSDRCEDADYDAVRGLTAWPDNVRTLDASRGTATVTLDTREGTPLCTLDWASSSQTACFPATEFFNFQGNAQLFALDPPPPAGSTVVARVVPERGVDASLVGWSTSVERFTLPPLMPTVGVCEASYARGIGDTTNPGVAEEIVFSNPPTGNPYNYAFAVAGPAIPELAGLVELQVEVFVPPPPHCPESLPGATYATWPTTVERISLERTGETTRTGSLTGDLADGTCTNLDWADQSSVACFPATRFDRFEGTHVQYALNEPMPPRSEMTITLTPTEGNDVNLYGFQAGATRFPVPPAIPGVIACEASYPGQIGVATNPGEVEQIFFSNPTDNPYNIAFVAAGPAGVDRGAYRIDIELRESTIHCEESLETTRPSDGWASSVQTFAIDGATGEGSIRGSIDAGSCTNLDFASDSSVACFPATRNDLFEGNVALFAPSTTMPPNSVLTVTLQPDEGVDLNLFGLQTGATVYPLPPDVPGAVACEASYGPAFVPGIFGDPANPGEPESVRFYNPTSNDYNILLGVAGPRGVTSGSFTLTANLEVGATHCEESLPGTNFDAWPAFVERLPFDGTTLEVEGELGRGACTNLDWADDSPNACFPGTLAEAFEGNHVFYAIEGEPAAGSTVRVELVEGDRASIYGYQVGAGRFPVPPAVSSVLACEYAIDGGTLVFTNPGEQPYQLFIGVAGANGVADGPYRFTVTRE